MKVLQVNAARRYVLVRVDPVPQSQHEADAQEVALHKAISSLRFPLGEVVDAAFVPPSMSGKDAPFGAVVMGIVLTPGKRPETLTKQRGSRVIAGIAQYLDTQVDPELDRADLVAKGTRTMRRG